MKLSPTHETLVAAVETADRNYREGRRSLRAELERQLEAQLSALETARALAAYDAFVGGVSKRQIGLRGLGTSDPNTASRAIENGKRIRSALNGSPILTTTATDEPTRIEPWEATEPEPQFTLEYIDDDPFEDSDPFQPNRFDFPERRRFEALIHGIEGAEDPVRMWFFDEYPTGRIVYPIGPDISDSDLLRVPHALMGEAIAWAKKVRAENPR